MMTNIVVQISDSTGSF